VNNSVKIDSFLFFSFDNTCLNKCYKFQWRSH